MSFCSSSSRLRARASASASVARAADGSPALAWMPAIAANTTGLPAPWKSFLGPGTSDRFRSGIDRAVARAPVTSPALPGEGQSSPVRGPILGSPSARAAAAIFGRATRAAAGSFESRRTPELTITARDSLVRLAVLGHQAAPETDNAGDRRVRGPTGLRVCSRTASGGRQPCLRGPLLTGQGADAPARPDRRSPDRGRTPRSPGLAPLGPTLIGLFWGPFVASKPSDNLTLKFFLGIFFSF